MVRPSQRTKILEGRGMGAFETYKPWINIREENSDGTCSAIKDYKHGRQLQLLSIAELKVYLKNRWRDDVIDIREQYPILNVRKTIEIAEALGYKHPRIGAEYAIMTTDFYIVKKDGTIETISVKVNDTALDDETGRTSEKLRIEEEYWKSQGIPWKLIYGDDISRTLMDNILDATRYYDGKKVHDSFSMAKHLVARKKILVNMEDPISWRELVRRFNIHEC